MELRIFVVATVLGHVIAKEYLDVMDVFPAIGPQKRSVDIYEHPPSMVVDVFKYRLNMVLNSGLVSPFFVSHYEDESGAHRRDQGHPNCFYHGSVAGHPDWHVALSTCHGLRGIFGDSGKRENYYYIEPAGEANAISGRHKLYVGYSDNNASYGACSKIKSLPLLNNTISASNFVHSRVRRQSGVRTVELAMVNDNSQYVAFGRNLTAVVLRDLEIANIVDSLFMGLNIRVAVVSTITWTQGNKIEYPDGNNLDMTLETFSLYVASLTDEHDTTMLITNLDLPGETVGYAYVGTMCQGQRSVSMTEDGNKRSLGVVATIAAHEIGHVFSMLHDNSSCTCSDSSGRCIMAASARMPLATSWSSCSVNALNAGFNRGLGNCLLNSPSRTVSDPVCGNGIREGDEVCDCGSLEECTDKCCNPFTCRLARGALCSGGQCCSEDCHFLPLGTVCRNASNECDILEYCRGDSSQCPQDVHKQDTTPCQNQQSVCYSGQCTSSRDDQCQQYYGSRSADYCYSSLNAEGSHRGNCGSSGSSYLPCEEEHATCGQLQCEPGLRIPNVGSSYSTVVTVLPAGSCLSFTLPPAADTHSLGLVQDGSKCGDKSICLGQKCMAVSALSHIQPCPVGSNNLTCAGQGECNNLNECSCTAGLYGDTCERTSPLEGRKLFGGTIAAIFFGLLFGAALVVLVIALVVYDACNRGNKASRETSSKSSESSTRSSTATSHRPAPRQPSRPVPARPVRTAPSRPLPQKC